MFFTRTETYTPGVLKKTVSMLLTLFTFSSGIHAQTSHTPAAAGISPYQFGWADAVSATDRYRVLLATHQAAVAAHSQVDYSGIDTIGLDIPDDFKSIPLAAYNDFKGCVIRVRNTQRRVVLFTCASDRTPVNVDKALIDTGVFVSVPELAENRKLLVIEDQNPWVEQRKGYRYGHQRRDILLLENGHAKNSVVMPYCNVQSSPLCVCISPRYAFLVVKNLTLIRDSSSTVITSAFDISGIDSVLVSDFSIITPESPLVGDNAVKITDCSNVTFSHVTIKGTYSRTDYYGYGILMDNIWNFRAENLFADGNWGVFGTNNMNTSTIANSTINRFDIHCYGRNAYFDSVRFFKLYNQFSSHFGIVSFRHCEFRDFVPVLIEPSYNAYTEFDLIVDSCVFYTTRAKNYLVNTGSLDGQPNARPELSEKKLPRLKVTDLKVFSLDSGRPKKRVAIFKKLGNFIRKRKINNTLKL